MEGFFLSQQVMGHADLKTSLTYLRGLEIQQLEEIHMPMLTIHDSVITDEEHWKLLQDQIEQTYIDKIGFKPTLAKEKLEESYSPLDVTNYVLGKAVDFNLNQNILKDIIMRTMQSDYVNEGFDFGMQQVKVLGADVKEFTGLNGKRKKVYIPNLQALKQALGE